MRVAGALDALETAITINFIKVLHEKEGVNPDETECLAGCFFAEVEDHLADGRDMDLEFCEGILRDILQGHCEEEERAAEAIMLELEFSGVCSVPADDGSMLAAPISVGDDCVAVLTEDGEWHEARVSQVLGEGRYIVNFDFGNKSQEVSREELCPLTDVINDNEEEEDECPVCTRVMNLTRHHLIPR